MTLPVVVEAGGFSTELVVTNFSSAAKRVDFAFVADSVQASDNTVRFFRTLQPSEQVIIPSLVQFLRDSGLASALPAGQAYAGPLIATTEVGDLEGIVVGARTAAPGGGGKYGLYYAAVPWGAANTSSTWLYGLQQNSENRSNLAIVNTGEIDANQDVFRIELFDGGSGLKVSAIERRHGHQCAAVAPDREHPRSARPGQSSGVCQGDEGFWQQPIHRLRRD